MSALPQNGVRKAAFVVYRLLATGNSVVCLSLVFHYIVGGGGAVANAVLSGLRAEETTDAAGVLASFLSAFAISFLAMAASYFFSRPPAAPAPEQAQPKEHSPVPAH